MEMAEWLDYMGASIGSGVGYDSARFSLHSLSDTLGEALDYLAAVILSPDFPPAEVDRIRAERIDEVRRSRDDPAEVAAEALSAAIFGDYPYGRPVRGSLETLEGLRASDLRSFREGSYAAGSSFLVAAGDVDPEEFTGQLESRFKNWPAAIERTPLDPYSGTAVAKNRVTLIDRPGSQQSELRVGAVGLARGDDDEFAVLVMNAILGGLFNSRLNLNLREDKGWTYGARSGFSLRRCPGPFVARAAVDTPVTARAFEEILSEIRSMVQRPPDDDELELAKNALILSLPRQFETTSQVAAKEAERVGYGLSDDWWESFPRRVRAVTRDDVVRVAGRYLDRAGLTLVAVGDATAVGGDLAGLGDLEVRSVP
jgi:zinc protease